MPKVVLCEMRAVGYIVGMVQNVTNELLFETLKQVQQQLRDLRGDVVQTRDELRAMKLHVQALVQSDLSRDAAQAALTLRIERIERRLELND